jgi:hypothetical protein
MLGRKLEEKNNVSALDERENPPGYGNGGES